MRTLETSVKITWGSNEIEAENVMVTVRQVVDTEGKILSTVVVIEGEVKAVKGE